MFKALVPCPSIPLRSCLDFCLLGACSCLAGYELQPDGRCVDIDECALGLHGCSDICENVPGSYRCSCLPGFAVDPLDSSKCIDIDECRTDQHQCSHSCVNTEGSYRCECPAGLRLGPDQRTCQQRKTCLEDPSICQGKGPHTGHLTAQLLLLLLLTMRGTSPMVLFSMLVLIMSRVKSTATSKAVSVRIAGADFPCHFPAVACFFSLI